MARRKRNGDRVIVGVVGIWVLLGLLRSGDWWAITQTATAAVIVVGIWVLYFRSTRCGYRTQKGEPCLQPVRGELRACRVAHKGLKAQALLNHLGIKHPRQLLQKAWMGESRQSPVEPKPVEGRLERPNYDIAMLAATIISAVAAVAMPVIQMVID